MNQQQPDKLFREKLGGYQRPAPARAWNKLEAGLDRKGNKVLWLKVAAALMFLAVAGYVLFSPDNEQRFTETQKVADNKINTSITDKKIIQESIKNIGLSNNFLNKSKSVKKIETQEALVKKIRTEEIVVTEFQRENVEPVVEGRAQIEYVEVKDNASAADVISVSKQRNSITLIYTAEEVNEKFLDKNAIAEATLADKKPSTLKKLLNKATGLTRDQDPVGELRQKKNEILALEFKKKNNVDKTDKAL